MVHLVCMLEFCLAFNEKCHSLCDLLAAFLQNAPLTSVKLPLEAAPAVGKLLARLTPIALSDLDLGDEDALDLATKLWAVGLLSAH